MPHITEGELHAYLDGALAVHDPARLGTLETHLNACADCRALLEEARAIRDRSHELLSASLARPGPPPPFEEIERRARRGTPVSLPKRGAGSVPRLAWAASLVVALGAGWAGHALLRSGPAGPPAGPVTGPVTGPVAGVAPPTESAPGPDAPGPASAASAAKAANAAPRQQRVALEEDASPAGRATDAVSAFRSDDGSTIAWREATGAEAAAWAGASPVTVPGLEVLGFETAVRGDERLVRVRQRLPGGDVLTIVEARWGGEESKNEEAAAETAEILFGGWRLSPEGTVAPDSLRALLSRVR